MRCRGTELGCILGAAAMFAAAGSALAQQKAPTIDRNADVVADEVVGNGYRRVFRNEVRPVTPEELALMIAEGKEFELDPNGGGIVTRTFTDYLPTGWLMEAPEGGTRVDSYGNPIVNDVQGLPAWSQRDVNSLLIEITNARDTLLQQRDAGEDTTEAEGVLGNYLGHSIARGIGVDHIVNIDNAAIVNAGVAQHIINYLHFYESERVNKQEVFGYEYTPTSYTGRIASFVARFGSSLEQVQQVDAAPPFGDRGSGCYNTTTSARGLTLLTTPTQVWVADNTDDTFADASTGFPLFYFYDCDDSDNNGMVRISSNGFVSFFEQGGGATDGANRFNNTLPDPLQVDGFAGPFWDDLIVSSLSGDQVRYKTEGTVGSRVFTMENYSTSHFGAVTGEFYYFQVKLYESSDLVEFHYDTVWSNNGEESATIGMENYAGTAAHCGPNCGPLNIDAPANNYRYTYFRPSGDSCGGAQRVFDGTTLAAESLHRASGDGEAGCGGTTGNRDRWYFFIATCDGTVNANTCGSRDVGGAGAGADTVLSAHSACPGTIANQLACSDDASVPGCNGLDSAVNVAVTRGQIVYFRATHFGNSTFRAGNLQYNFNVNFTESNAAPANDNCVNATQVFNGDSFNATLGCASNDGFSGCGGSGSNSDVWYWYRAACAGTLTVDACGTVALGTDPVLSLHSGCPGNAGNQITCNDDAGLPGCAGFDSQVSAVLAPGDRVLIRVSHFSASFGLGNFHLNVAFTSAPPAPPVNDLCAAAIPVSCGSSTIGNTCGASFDAAPSCGSSITTPGVWYTVLGTGGPMIASTCDPFTSYDTKLHVFSGACGALACIDGNDDAACPSSTVGGLTSRVFWNSTAGATYRILVSGFGGGTGAFMLNVGVANDHCNFAIPVAPGNYTGNITCATNDSSGTTCGFAGNNRDVWYTFTAPFNGVMTVGMCGTMPGMDPTISLYSGCPANGASFLTCNDDGGRPGCNAWDSYLEVPVSAGDTRLIRISHFDVSLGSGIYHMQFDFFGCDSIDWNGDGLFPDIQDIADFINVFQGGTCAPPNPPICNTDIDFNNDGLFPDIQDIADLIDAFAGGACP